MYTPESLVDLHERGHRSLKVLLEHCGRMSQDDLEREFEGFGYPSIRLQFHHLIGAEAYWIGVIAGRLDVDDDAGRYPTIDALERYRQTVFAQTKAYLERVSPQELNAPRAMTTWGGHERMLMPAHVFLRTATHVYAHAGQILAMCRLLGKPASGTDFPLI